MQSFFHKIADLHCGWNEKPLAEDTFHKLCRKHKIRLKIMPLTVCGFYHCTKGKHYIAIDSRLSPIQTVFVMFHEFAHFLMHSPGTDATASFSGSMMYSRDEQEADAFAYCALLPLARLKNEEPEHLADEFGSQFLMERLRVYDRYGI